MVVAGGFGVLAVLWFVAALAVAGRPPAPQPGDRVAVASGGTIHAFRCRAERVTLVELLGPDGEPVWRIRSRKGSIDRRYVVGGEVPLGFVEEVPSSAGVPDEATAVVEFDGESRDRTTFSGARLPEGDAVLYRGVPVRLRDAEARARSVAGCAEAGRDLEGPTLVFAVAALGVVGTYGLLVNRWWRGPRS